MASPLSGSSQQPQRSIELHTRTIDQNGQLSSTTIDQTPALAEKTSVPDKKSPSFKESMKQVAGIAKNFIKDIFSPTGKAIKGAAYLTAGCAVLPFAMAKGAVKGAIDSEKKNEQLRQQNLIDANITKRRMEKEIAFNKDMRREAADAQLKKAETAIKDTFQEYKNANREQYPAARERYLNALVEYRQAANDRRAIEIEDHLEKAAALEKLEAFKAAQPKEKTKSEHALEGADQAVRSVCENLIEKGIKTFSSIGRQDPGTSQVDLNFKPPPEHMESL